MGRLLFDTNSISREAKEEFIRISKETGKDSEFAYLLDSFAEERSEGFTLDTTQAFLRCKDREYILIDVPGHKGLIKNMLTGTSYADAAIIVCDAEKSLEEQTRRHLYLLRFLGIDEFMVVINKMDKVGYNNLAFEKAKAEINAFLNKINLHPLCVIPISAKLGENIISVSGEMNWYKGSCLLETMRGFSIKEEESQDFRFPLQDIYIRDRKEIIVGTVASGVVRKKDKIKVAPEELNTCVKRIIVLDKEKRTAKSRESIGLVLDRKGKFKRGQVLYKETPPQVTAKFPAKVFCLHPFTETEEFIFKSNIQESSCNIFQIKEVIDTVSLNRRSSKDLGYGEAGEVVLKAEKPLVIESFSNTEELGRFILHKGGKVYAVGIIP